MSNRPYDWHVILILPSMSLEEHQAYWRVMSKRLTQSRLNLVWMREITLENRLHYHCLAKSSLSKEQVRKCFEAATPSEITLRVSSIDSQIGLIEYLLKLGKFKRKRVYFAKENTLNKHGVIGHPFSLSLKEHRQKVICRERRMTAALAPWAEYFDVPLAELRCALSTVRN